MMQGGLIDRGGGEAPAGLGIRFLKQLHNQLGGGNRRPKSSGLFAKPKDCFENRRDKFPNTSIYTPLH
jgi:hypothetical protein